MRTFTNNTIGVLLGGLLAAAGCTETPRELEDQPCTAAADCWHDQTCMRTDAEAMLDLPGACVAQGEGCLPDEQLGCGCDPDDRNACIVRFRPLPEGYPAMMCDAGLAVCVPAVAGDSGDESGGTES